VVCKKVTAKKAAKVQIKLGCFMTRFPTRLESKGKSLGGRRPTYHSKVFRCVNITGGGNLVIGKSPKLHSVNNITKPHNTQIANNKAWKT
jgi:hypothetical protein